MKRKEPIVKKEVEEIVDKNVIEETEEEIEVDVDEEVIVEDDEEVVPVKVEEPVVVETTKLRWKKLGGGSLRWNNQIIKPGQVFEASLEDLPKAFLESLQCLEPEKKATLVTSLEKEKQIPEVLYKLKKIKGSDLYNLINAENKALNEEPLTLDAAEKMLAVINK